MPTKQELVQFLEDRVLSPVENHPEATPILKKKVRCTRMRLDTKCRDARAVEHFFWSAMSTPGGIDTYDKGTEIGAPTFESVRADFKQLCGH
jgi:hypothetical protein